MDLIQSMRPSRTRIVLIAVVLAVAGLLVSASQIAPAGAATTYAARGAELPALLRGLAGGTVRQAANAGVGDASPSREVEASS